MSRVESGPLRFGDDWAGVFLRGDYAGPMAFYLSSLFEALDAGRKPSPNITLPLRGFATVLAGSDERGSLDGLQQLPDFALCKSLPDRIAALEQIAADHAAGKMRPPYVAGLPEEFLRVVDMAQAAALQAAIKMLRGDL